MTRPSLREYAAVQRERYLAATRAEKGTFLNELVTVTGIHRKAPIRLLRRTPRAPTARSRAGRPRVYGPAVGAVPPLPLLRSEGDWRTGHTVVVTAGETWAGLHPGLGLVAQPSTARLRPEDGYKLTALSSTCKSDQP